MFDVVVAVIELHLDIRFNNNFQLDIIVVVVFLRVNGRSNEMKRKDGWLVMVP